MNVTIHSLDIPLIGMAIPRHSTIRAADKWKGTLGGWAIEAMTRIISSSSTTSTVPLPRTDSQAFSSAAAAPRR